MLVSYRLSTSFVYRVFKLLLKTTMIGGTMDIIQAIEKRISCRAFTDQQVEQEKFDALVEEATRINEETGLHFQIFGPCADGTVINMSDKMFAGNPPCYAALVAKKDPVEEEKLGYFGERLVLFAEMMGLSTCWVAGTFDRATTRVELDEGEVLHDVIPIGYAPAKIPLKQRTIRAGIRSRSKALDDLYRGPVPLGDAPEWIQACVDAVWKGPSAINEQPVVFVQDDVDGPVRAELIRVKSGMEYTDLGIAKYHFAVVADACGVAGAWEWGVGGTFA